MGDIAFRITRGYAELDAFVKDLNAEAVLVYQHDKDEEVSRTHCHGLIQGATISILGIKRRLQHLLGKIEKADWSFKNLDSSYRVYITYMSKGELEPKYNKGFSDEELTNLKNAWVSRADYKQTKLLEAKRDRKKTMDSIVDEVVKISNEIDHRNPVDCLFVMTNLVQRLNDQKIYTSDNKVCQMFQSVIRVKEGLKQSYISKLCAMAMKN